VNTRGDCRRDCRADDHLVYSLYYPRHYGQVARIKECCVDNAVGLDGQRWCRCAQQQEVQSKVDVLGGPTATTAVSAVQAVQDELSVKSHETDLENGYENR